MGTQAKNILRPVSELSDFDLQTRYQEVKDLSGNLYFDTVYDFRDFLVSQKVRLLRHNDPQDFLASEDGEEYQLDSPMYRCMESRKGEGEKDELNKEELEAMQASIDTVEEYILRQKSVKKASSADSFNSDTTSHRSGRFSPYIPERESPPRATQGPVLTPPVSSASMHEDIEANDRMELTMGTASLYEGTGTSDSDNPPASTYRTAVLPVKDQPFIPQVDEDLEQIHSKVRAASGKANDLLDQRAHAKNESLMRQVLRQSRTIQKLKAKIRDIHQEKEHYRQERDYFRYAFYATPGRAMIPPRPLSPQRRTQRTQM